VAEEIVQPVRSVVLTYAFLLTESACGRGEHLIAVRVFSQLARMGLRDAPQRAANARLAQEQVLEQREQERRVREQREQAPALRRLLEQALAEAVAIPRPLAAALRPHAHRLA